MYHGTSTDIVDTGLTPGTLYIYKLQAYKEAGSLTVYTAYSPEATAVPLDAPSAPVAEVIDETSVKLTWAAVFGADSCSLWQSTNPDGPFTQLYSGTSLNHTNTGLITGTPYYYKVRAHKTIGADTYYGPFSGISTAVPRDTSAMHGDANDDGEVDILDLVSIIDYIISNTPCADMANADANEDGEIDILDLVWIIDYIVGD